VRRKSAKRCAMRDEWVVVVLACAMDEFGSTGFSLWVMSLHGSKSTGCPSRNLRVKSLCY
jgi:hypothetical protein